MITIHNMHQKILNTTSHQNPNFEV